MRNFVKWVINIVLCHFVYRVKYIGAEKVNKLDKCLICPNHSNTLEPTWIYAKNDNIAIMAKAELFNNKLIGKIFTYFNVFPIHRGERDVRSLIHAINLFKNVDKMKLLVFPEGERLKEDKERVEAKVGPAYIAHKVGVPIVPVYITKNVKLFSKVVIIYGDPIFVSDEVGKDKEKLQEFSDKLMDSIYQMGKEYYKNSK